MGYAPQISTPQPGGYGTPQGFNGPNPYAQPLPTPPPAPSYNQTMQTGKSSSKVVLLVVIIAGLAAAGGVAAYFATRKPKVEDVKKPDDNDVKPDKKDDDVKPDKKDDDDVKPDKKDDDVPPKKEDVWGGAGGGGTTTANLASEVLVEMNRFTNRMCTCTDKACADGINNEMTTWGTEIAKRTDAKTLDAAAQKQVADVMKRYSDCMVKAMTAAKAPPPPPPPLDIMREFEKFADRACNCSTEPCARAVLNDVLAFARKHKDFKGGSQARGEAAGRRMGQCLVTAGMDAQELIKAFQSFGK